MVGLANDRGLSAVSSMFAGEALPSVEHYPHHHFLPMQYLPLALTRSPKGLAMHKLLLHSKFLWFGIEAEISCV